MKRSKFASAIKALLVFGAVLLVLTVSLTTATMQPLNEGFEAGGKTAYAAANNGGEPKKPEDIIPYLTTPEQQAAYKKLLKTWPGK